jgi:hypothetical protein
MTLTGAMGTNLRKSAPARVSAEMAITSQAYSGNAQDEIIVSISSRILTALINPEFVPKRCQFFS